MNHNDPFALGVSTNLDRNLTLHVNMARRLCEATFNDANTIYDCVRLRITLLVDRIKLFIASLHFGETWLKIMLLSSAPPDLLAGAS